MPAAPGSSAEEPGAAGVHRNPRREAGAEARSGRAGKRYCGLGPLGIFTPLGSGPFGICIAAGSARSR
ncbi:hypothetical protein GCM10027440_41760 [Nocardiopsis coralliicola]